MNCPECKHPIESHTDGCLHRLPTPYGWAYCGCNAVEADTENTILEKRLTLARELIAALTNNGQLSPRLMTPETKTLWERWQAEEGKP